MKWMTLPETSPYREMIAFFHPYNVELWINRESLQSCAVVARTMIDCFSDNVSQGAEGMFVFWYSPDNWERLCSALHEKEHDAHSMRGPHRDGTRADEDAKAPPSISRRFDNGTEPRNGATPKELTPEKPVDRPGDDPFGAFRPRRGPEGSDV